MGLSRQEQEYIDREYEKTRAQFSCDFRELLKEHKMTYRDIADTLRVTVPKVRQMIQSDNITFKDIVTLTAVLGGRCRVLIIIPRP